MGPYKKNETVVRTHSYYQWVGFVLLFQTGINISRLSSVNVQTIT